MQNKSCPDSAAESLAKCYSECLALAHRHYENFPVASRLLPKHVRLPIAVIYTFARRADDWADEGDFALEVRLQALTDMAKNIENIEFFQENFTEKDCLWPALADVIKRFHLDKQLFLNLLQAFQQDVVKNRYENFAEIIQYCRLSANPVGRLLLALFEVDDTRALAQSDAVCTALQLINFYQDLSEDLQKRNRLYLPLDELAQLGISESEIFSQKSSEALRNLMQKQYQRAKKLLDAGAPLGKRLPGRLGLEIRLIIVAADKVLEKRFANRQVFQRPRLYFYDYPSLLWKALWAK
jgi:squalene synthase HpnC